MVRLALVKLALAIVACAKLAPVKLLLVKLLLFKNTPSSIATFIAEFTKLVLHKSALAKLAPVN